jgi:dUTP pyrophosphatase
MTLRVKCLDENIKNVYIEYIQERNDSYDITASGFNTICVEEQVIPANSFANKIKLGIVCQPLEKHGYTLCLRSSTGKNTRLRLSNQIGIIDENYRGEIMALVDNFDNEDYVIRKEERLFQLVFPSLKPFKVELVDNIDESDRGSNGFGSTGTGTETNNI